MLGFSLLSPIFLVGALAVAVPIIIHLMQRKRARVVPFGTIRFLREIHAKLSMRQKIREMLLLALRIALILLLALAMARPVLKGAAFSGKEDAPVTMVYIVDNSLSMSAQIGGVTNFERARSLLLAQAETMKSADRMAILPVIPMFDEKGAVKNEALPSGDLLEEVIRGLKQGYGIGDPSAALSKAVEIVQNADTTNLEIYFLSEFQQCTFKNLEPTILSGLKSEVLERLAVYAVDFTNEGLRNAAPRMPVVKRGFDPRTVMVSAEIVNYSREGFDVKVAALANNRKIGEKMISLPAEGKVPFEMELPLADEGFQRLVIALDGDDLTADNMLNMAYFSAPVIKAIIVNGRPSSVPTLDAAYYLRSALDPGWKRGQLGMMGISTLPVSPEEITPRMLETANVVFLCDIATFSPSLRDALISFVRAGGGLVVVPGSQTNLDAYNTILSRPVGAEALLPGLTRGIINAEGTKGFYVNFASLSLLHPVWAGIPEKALQDLSNEPWTTIVKLESDPSVSDVEQLAGFENGWPAILSAKVGMGRVILMGFPFDRQWSSLPLRSVFPPICHRIAHYAAGTLIGLRKHVEVNKPMVLFMRKSADNAKFRVKYPSLELDIEPTLKEDGFHLNAPGSPDPGFVFFLPNKEAGFSGHLVAVNPPVEESLPEYMKFEDLKAKLGFSSLYSVNDPGRLSEIRTRLKTGTPIWGMLFFIALLLLAAETLLGNDIVNRILAGRKAEAATLGPLSKTAINTLRRRRREKKEAN